MTNLSTPPITLEQYAGIIVLRDEGHALEEVLAQEQLPPEAWDDIDVDFKDRLSQEEELFSRYAALVIEAEDALKRTVTPLEQDPVAYLAFVNHFTSADPGPLLAAHALTLADIGRLGRHWQREFSADEDLRKRSAKEAGSASSPTNILVGVAELKPFRWTAEAAIGVSGVAGASQPNGGLSLSARPSPDAMTATSAPATSAPATSAPATSAPATSAPATSAPATSAPAVWGPTAPEPTGRSLEPNLAMGETAPLRRGPTAPATPFAGSGPAPRRTRLEPHPNLGGTASSLEPRPLEPRPLEPVALEPVALEPVALEPVAKLGETAAVGDVDPLALPFAGKNAPPARAPLEPHAHLGGTAPLRTATHEESAEPMRSSTKRKEGGRSTGVGGTISMPQRDKASLEPNPALGGTIVMPAEEPDSS